MDPYLQELQKLHETYKSDRFSKLGISIALGVDRRTVRRWFQCENLPSEKHRKKIENLVRELKKEIENQQIF